MVLIDLSAGRRLGEARLLFVACRAYLYHGTVATDLDRNGLARLRVLAQLALAHTVLVALVHHLLDLGFQLGIERAHVLAPLVFALGDLVKLLFYARGEIVIHDVGEVLQEKLRHHCAHVRGNQLALVGSRHLRLLLRDDLVVLERIDAVDALLALAVALLHILALLDGGDGGRVG